MAFNKISEKLKIPDVRRFKWSCWIFFLSLLVLLIFYLYKEKVFYITITDGFDYVYRLLWILPFSFIGFSFLAFLNAKGGASQDPPWITYLFSYFPRVIAWSLIIFSVLHLFTATSNYIYYFFSAGLGLYIGYHIDSVQLEKLLEKIK